MFTTISFNTRIFAKKGKVEILASFKRLNCVESLTWKKLVVAIYNTSFWLLLEIVIFNLTDSVKMILLNEILDAAFLYIQHFEYSAFMFYIIKILDTFQIARSTAENFELISTKHLIFIVWFSIHDSYVYHFLKWHKSQSICHFKRNQKDVNVPWVCDEICQKLSCSCVLSFDKEGKT